MSTDPVVGETSNQGSLSHAALTSEARWASEGLTTGPLPSAPADKLSWPNIFLYHGARHSACLFLSSGSPFPASPLKCSNKQEPGVIPTFFLYYKFSLSELLLVHSVPQATSGCPGWHVISSSPELWYMWLINYYLSHLSSVTYSCSPIIPGWGSLPHHDLIKQGEKGGNQNRFSLLMIPYAWSTNCQGPPPVSYWTSIPCPTMMEEAEACTFSYQKLTIPTHERWATTRAMANL